MSGAVRSFAGNLRVRARAARRMGLARAGVRALRKTGILDRRWLRRWELLHDPRISRPQWTREFLDRYEALAGPGCAWLPLRFAGRRVLEIGCGPFGGWGPLAVFRGAAAYVGADPALDPALLFEDRLAAAYLAPLFADLAGHAEGGDATAAMESFRARARYLAAPIEALDDERRFDLVLSNSCLEHIDDFAGFVPQLVRRLAPGARMLHLVDFSNHRDKEAPFAAVYEMPPDAYHHRFGRHINLLRAPDMQAALEGEGLRVRWVAVDARPEALDGLGMDRWWTARYSREMLALRAALLLAEAAPPGE